MDLSDFSTVLARNAVGRWDLRWIDDHGHSLLTVLDLGAIEIDGVCAVHGDLESRVLYIISMKVNLRGVIDFWWTYPFTSRHWHEAGVHPAGQRSTWRREATLSDGMISGVEAEL